MLKPISTTRTLLRATRLVSVLRPATIIRPRTLITLTPRVLRPLSSRPITCRYYSPLCQDKPAKLYSFEDVQKLATNGHPGTVLVDVREPHEYKDGHIPTAVNVPYNSSPGAFALESEEFHEAFGFEKPSVDQHLVFYCLGGVRSSAAEGIAATYGYQR
jgi:rhodanese-related sulfurtransferase